MVTPVPQQYGEGRGRPGEGEAAGPVSRGRAAAPIVSRVLITAAVYAGAGELGLRLAALHDQTAPLWLPIGVAVVALLRFGLWTAPGITIAAFAVNLPIMPSVPVAAVIAAGDTLAPVCAYLLLRRTGFRLELDRLRDAVALVFLAAFGSMLISATVGGTALLAAGATPPEGYWQTWLVWWTGDAMGVLVGVPFLLALRTLRRRDLGLIRLLELTVLFAGTLAAAVAVTSVPYGLLFLLFPPLIWAALRFGHTGAAPCVVICALAASVAAARGHGPFAFYESLGRLVVLQTFNSAAAVTALLLAVMVSERDTARGAVDRVAVDLAKMTDDLERGQRDLSGMVLDLVRAQRRPGDREPPA